MNGPEHYLAAERLQEHARAAGPLSHCMKRQRNSPPS